MKLTFPITSFWQRARNASYFGSQVLLTMGGNMAGALLGLITGPLAARLLGPHGRGELAAIQTWPSFLALIGMLGLHEATVYFSAREPAKAGRYVASATTLALLASLPFLVASYLLMPLMLAAQSPEVIAAAQWYLLLIPLYALVLTPLNGLRGRGDLVVWNILKLTPPIGWLLVLLAASLIGTATPQSITRDYLIVFALLFFPIVAIVRWRIGGSMRPDPRLWRPMLNYGLPTVAGVVPYVLNLRLDQLLMAAFLAPRLLGFYAVAVAWAAGMSPMLRAIGVVIFPMVASRTDEREQIKVLSQGSRLGVLLAAGAAALFLVLTPFAIPLLFGADFAPAIPCALVLIVAEAAADMTDILREGMRGLGKTKPVMVSEIFGLGTAAITLWALLPRLGIMGAALASLFGYAASTAFLAFQIRRTTGSSFAALLRPRREDVQLIIGRVLAIVRKERASA